MANPRTQMTCERVDDDEVLVTLTNLGLDCDGDKIEIRLAFYEDTENLEVSIETRADSVIVAESRRSSDITLRFEDVPNPFLVESEAVDYEECDCCGDELGTCDCDEFCGDDEEDEEEDCECGHCSCYPERRCCFCVAVDTAW